MMDDGYFILWYIIAFLLIIVGVAIFIFGDTHGRNTLLEECQEKYNVYECEMKPKES